MIFTGFDLLLVIWASFSEYKDAVSIKKDLNQVADITFEQLDLAAANVRPSLWLDDLDTPCADSCAV